MSASGGALIVDLASLQDILTGDALEPAQVTQWWLATSAAISGMPPGLAATLPPGSAVTSSAAVASALVGDPLSTVPQQALLAVAVAAAVLAITGFCVSIAAGVRQRRAENALLAALGVAPRAAAGQLGLEKLMLSLPSALAGLVLGVVLAELLVPAITLAAGQWASLSTKLFVVSGAGPRAQAETPPRLEVVYRDPLTSNAQLAAGTYASAAVPPGMVAVAATTQTAARFGLHPGTRLSVATPTGPVRLFVTAIVRERAPGSTFWAQDSTAGTPALNHASIDPYWAGGVFADPGQLAAMQDAFSGPGMELNWEFPLAVGGVTADQAQGLDNALNRAATMPLALTGPLAASADTLTVTSPLTSDLSLFLGTQAAIETVLLLLFVSLIVVGAAVILLAARMIVARRDDELTMLRARGGSLRQVAALMARAAVLAAGPRRCSARAWPSP